MNRTFDITLDIAKPIDPDNTFRLFRGDNVTFNFTFKNGENDFDTSSAVKSRVYAKRVYADGVKKLDEPIFAGEFTTITSATFTSTQTAGDAANYLMAVILLDANNNLITAQGIFFDLIENGYAGYYQPAQDFRDEVLDALAQAQQAATNAATSASNAAQSATTAEQEATAASVARDDAYLAQVGAENAKDTAVEANTQAQAAKQAAIDAANTATQAAGIQAIRQEMLTKGYLHCTAGGYATGGFTGDDMLSVIFKTNADFSSVADDNVLSFFLLGVYQNGFDMQLGDDHVCRFKRNSNGFKSFSQTAIAAKATNKINIICAVFKKLEDGNADGTLYVNGSVISPITTAEGVYPTFGNKYYVNNVSGTQGGRSKTYVSYQDFMIFNFDIFAEGAPYTYTDYANGNLVPLTLKDTTAVNRALLILENYTILNGSSRFIPDVSGNGQDATVGTYVGGTISGDADISIAKLKEYLTANT